MDWTKFNTHGESCNHAFEVMCNLLFEAWCKREFGDQLKEFAFVNGAGGDGGVEAFCTLDDGRIIGIQSKWFPTKIESAQIKQIESSFLTAIKIRPQIFKYVVCLPRDLGSKRMVRGGKIALETEENNWKLLVESLKKKGEGVSIELWNETRIQEILTWPELQGAYKFWFDNSIVFDDQFKISYNKAINSWAKTKYIPDLYTEGYIHQTLEAFLGSYSLTERRYKEWCKMQERLSNLKQAYEDLLTLNFPAAESELKEKIVKDISVLNKWLDFLTNGKETIKLGKTIPFISDFSLTLSVEEIKKSSLHFQKYFHFRSVECILENLIDDFFCFKELQKGYGDNRLIIIGNPGSGKTIGAVSEINDYFNEKTHLPVLVHAKEFSEGETWSTIIEKTLGLSSDWEEKELLFALQSAAQLRMEIKSKEYGLVPNCVIFVDGIDESASWNFWREKIEEISVFHDLYPRIKFVFLSRPYVFRDRYDLDYKSDFSSIPYYGDVPSEELCEVYFQKYNISVGKNNWVKKLLRTPIAVQLFCDLFKNSTIDNIEKNTTVITQLFRKKIELIESHFSSRTKQRSSHTIHSALCAIAMLFINNEMVALREIKEKIDIGTDVVLQELLDFLEDEGFICSFNRKDDDFSPVITYYSWGIQPAFDYLVGRKLFSAIEQGEHISAKYSIGIYEMLALIVIEEKGKLLFEYNNIELDDDIFFEILCYTLSNASIGSVEPFRDYLMGIMEYSVGQFREIVKDVIVPVSDIDAHPLGSLLLDEFLRRFSTPAERDIWWSIPAYLRDNYHVEWKAYSVIEFNDIVLKDDDTAFTRPLFIAWSLSSVNNKIRRHSRLELLVWGMNHPYEFWKLFLYLSDLDDEQVLEDMFSIAYGIALDQSVPEKYVKEAADWVLEKVFSEFGLKKYENSAIRYYSSCIVKVAVTKGIVKDAVTKMVTPPYRYEVEKEEIAIEAINADRMGGYSAIDYDLARYVLCDPLDVFFRIDHSQKGLGDEASAFINYYRQKYNLPEIKVEGLIISMALHYLKTQGWSEAVFWNHDDPQNLGVDNYIRATYYPATHGAMSTIMTVAEKNIWLARHHIECILSNEIAIRNYNAGTYYLNDYSQLENFVNPYQEYVNKSHSEQEDKWYHINLLANLESDNIQQNVIEAWMKETSPPNFKKWIFDNNGMVIIDAFTNVRNDASGIEEAMWISSGIVEKKHFAKWIESLNTYSEERAALLNPGNFHAYMDCNCYCTPQEVCLVHQDKETESSVVFHLGEENIEVKKTSVGCVCADENDVEKTYSLPSSFIRVLTGIVYGDRFEYKTAEGKVVACFVANGENWGTQQQVLLIDSNDFKHALEEKGYIPFWMLRVYRSPSNKSYERYPNILHNTDITYLVWEEEDIQHIILDEIEPPMDGVRKDSIKAFESIMAQLRNLEEDNYGQ